MSNVLVLIGRYLPGYKAGGPVRSLEHLVAALGDEFAFQIITRDRDEGEHQPYAGVVPGQWASVGKAQVAYLTSGRSFFPLFIRLLRQTPHDLLLLNSFFDTLTILALVLRRLGLLVNRPVILAPRGEFSRGALSLKPQKKRLYLWVSKQLGLLHDIQWLATSEQEADEIRAQLTRESAPCRITRIANLAADWPAAESLPSSPPKHPGQARIIFLSRISRKKNLRYALDILTTVQGAVQFDIYGPEEDRAYWAECQKVIQRLPAHVVVVYHGPVTPIQVLAKLGSAHLLLLPTLGENYGHVILEALSAGCPVLISDRTPWRSLESVKAGWAVPLEQPECFHDALATLVAMDENEFRQWSEGAQAFARTHQMAQTDADAYRSLFARLIEDSHVHRQNPPHHRRHRHVRQRGAPPLPRD